MSDRKEVFLEGDRAFLNLDGYHGDASVSWEVEIEMCGRATYNSGNFNIRDCSETISLSLDFHSQGYYENSMHKLQVLIMQARAAQKALRRARKDSVNREKTK